MRASTKTQKAEPRRAKDYFNEHLERIRYPQFIEQQLPIAFGIVEAARRSVICQRTNSAGMRWMEPPGRTSRPQPALRQAFVLRSLATPAQNASRCSRQAAVEEAA